MRSAHASCEVGGKGKHGDKAAKGRAAVTFLVECVDDIQIVDLPGNDPAQATR